MDYRKDIQGLRAIAIISVIIFHLNKEWLQGGFLGVDIFFVVSGFLISSIILHKLYKTHSFNFSFYEFYKSRIMRIVPAFYVMLLVVSFASIFIFVLNEDITSYIELLKNTVFFTSNTYIQSTVNDYFNNVALENPLLHTWTLAIEMQFYIFLPFLLFFINKKYLFTFISFITVILFFYGTYYVSFGDKGIMYFSLLARAPEFLIGVLVSIFIFNGGGKNKNYTHYLGYIGAFILIMSLFFFSKDSFFPGISAIIPCLGTAFLIISNSGIFSKILSTKILVFLGEISYSLYLLHWPIMAFVRYYYQIEIFSLLQIIFILILTFFLSILTYFFVENVFRKKKKFINLILTFLVGGVIFFGANKLLIIKNNISTIYSKPEIVTEFKDEKSLKKYFIDSKIDKVKKDEIKEKEKMSLNNNLKPFKEDEAKTQKVIKKEITHEKITPEMYSKPSTVGDKSHSTGFKKVETLGDINASGPNILLIGDSHALNMKKYFDLLGKEYNFKFRTLSNDSYPLLPGIKIIANNQYEKSYEKLIEITKDEIKNASIIIFQMSEDESKESVYEYEKVFSNFIKELGKDQYFIYLKDWPHFNENPLKKNRGIKKTNTTFTTLNTNLEKVKNAIISGKNSYYLDLYGGSKIFKNAPFYDDNIMYYDQAHLNEYGIISYVNETGYKFMNLFNDILRNINNK